MARIGIVFGLLLCGLSAFGMVATVTKDPIQFVPLMLGIPILFCGVVALNPHRRRLSMHAASAVGVIGVMIASVEAISMAAKWNDGEPVDSLGWQIIIAMTWFCAIFVVISFVGLIRERRKAKDASINPLLKTSIAATARAHANPLELADRTHPNDASVELASTSVDRGDRSRLREDEFESNTKVPTNATSGR